MEKRSSKNAPEWSIPKPCEADWEEMKTCGMGMRFCSACQTPVIDLNGKSRAEIAALLEAGEGNICVSLREDDQFFGAALLSAKKRALPQWLKRAATIAAAVALLNTAEAAGHNTFSHATVVLDATESGSPDSASNTLVSGVVLNGGRNITNDIEIRIVVNGLQARQVQTTQGFFHLDLRGIAEPDDKIEVIIPAQNFGNKRDGRRTYRRVRQQLRLADAQNIVLEADIDAKFSSKSINANRKMGKPVRLGNI